MIGGYEVVSFKAQVSMEYLLIFGIALMMTLPLIVIFVEQTDNVQADITNAQMTKVSSKIIDYAEAVYFMGEPSQKTLQIDFPKGVNSVVVGSNIITFNVTTTDRNYVVMVDTIAVLNGSIRNFEGLHIITFKAVNNTVQIIDK